MEILASRVLLRPRDFEVSLAFYEDMLGLHRFREFGSPPNRGVVLFLGGGYLEITESTADQDLESPAGVRLWLQVRDVRAELDRLRDGALADIRAEAERKPWGLTEATICDPDGLAVLLVEVPPDHPMRRDTR